MLRSRKKPLISVVSPVRNNAEQIRLLLQEIKQAVGAYRCEVIFVDDCSSDQSWQIIRQLATKRFAGFVVRGLKLSRNFGQHAAIHAGLIRARGDYIVVLDADLQDNPAYIPQMLAKALAGVDVVHTRRVKKAMTWPKFVSVVAHKILTRHSEIAMHDAMGNYKLLSRRALDAALSHRLDIPVFELMVAKAGFKADSIEVERRSRPVKGSAYTVGKSFHFFFGLMLAYSSLIFRIWMILGALFIAGAVASLVAYFLTASIGGLMAFAALLSSGCILLVGAILGYHVRAFHVAMRGEPVVVVEEEV